MERSGIRGGAPGAATLIKVAGFQLGGESG